MSVPLPDLLRGLAVAPSVDTVCWWYSSDPRLLGVIPNDGEFWLHRRTPKPVRIRFGERPPDEYEYFVWSQNDWKPWVPPPLTAAEWWRQLHDQLREVLLCEEA